MIGSSSRNQTLLLRCHIRVCMGAHGVVLPSRAFLGESRNGAWTSWARLGDFMVEIVCQGAGEMGTSR